MNIIRKYKSEIMHEWQLQVQSKIEASENQSKIALYDSLPDFLENLARILDPKDQKEKFIAEGKEDLIGKVHGQHRANNSYSIDQMIDEYFILKNVVFSFIRQYGHLDVETCDQINNSFQKALQMSAAQFSKSLLDSQENFVLNLAHDLRSPLMVIKMQAELMIKRAAYDKDKCLKIGKSVDKVDSMIEHLLNTIKTQSHGMGFLDLLDFDLFNLISEISHEYEDLYPGIINIQGTSTIVKWNQLSIERVIDNLLSNALKYGDTTKPVTIKVDHDEDNTFLSVHNFGNPISTQDQLTLFQKFKRTKETMGKKGWGIGLSYVKSVVEAHKGIVLVHSDEKGTTFKFEIPRDVSASQKASLVAARSSAALTGSTSASLS